MTGAKLALTFIGANGSNMKLNYGYINEEVEPTDVRTLAQTIITNGSIFSNPPVSSKSAKLIVTTETDIELNA